MAGVENFVILTGQIKKKFMDAALLFKRNI